MWLVARCHRRAIKCDAIATSQATNGVPCHSNPASPRQGLMKDLGGNVLGLFAARHPACYERVDPVEIGLVERTKASRVTLSGFNQAPLVNVVLGNFQSGLRRDPRRGFGSYLANDAKEAESYGLGAEIFGRGRRRVASESELLS